MKLTKMAPSLPSLRSVFMCILLLTCYHFMVIMYSLLHVESVPSHALLNAERLDFISTQLKEIYKLKDSVEKDPRQSKLNALRILLDNLRTLEEVISPWDLADIKRVKKVQERSKGSTPEKEVCPETYYGHSYGEPLYEKGFETANCEGVPDLGSILTILLDFHQSEEDFRRFGLKVVHSVIKIHPEVPMIVAVPRGINVFDLDIQVRPNLSFLKVIQSRNQGDVWNDLINNAKTKYVFVGRDLTHFDRDTNIERLVREIGGLSLAFVGGATRSSEGHWSISCLQSHHRNYKISYEQGYHHSRHGCVFCDAISGPFVAGTRALRSRALDRKLVGTTAFEDLFLRLKRARIKTAVCPDAMFHVASNILPIDKALWLPFAEKWGMNILSFSKTRRLEYSCQELRISCKGANIPEGKSIPPCCLKELSRSIHTVLQGCEAVGIECELQASTLLGAVKLGKFLPWERGVTITFLSSNYTAMDNLNKVLKGDRLSLLKEQMTFCCTKDRLDGGEYRLVTSSHGLPIKLAGQYKMTGAKLTAAGIPHTKVSHDGRWVKAPRNPGLYLRNKYGLEVMRHVEGRTMPMDQTAETTGFFSCPTLHNHDCLDQYEPDGTLQFDEQ